MGTKPSCRNCGANQWLTQNGRTYCAYCHTEYESKPLRARSRKLIWLFLAILSLCFIIALAIIVKPSLSARATKLTNIQNSSSVSDKVYEQNLSSNIGESAEKKEIARKNIERVVGWTMNKYNAVKLAGFVSHKNDKNGDYVGGTVYSNLVKEIGQPTSLIEYTQYYPTGTAIEGKATWNSTDESVSIIIYYDKSYDQVINKQLYVNNQLVDGYNY
ncbi:MAG: TFIIB-type zinc finger domain-containing protein [Streptococcaceae bacterium]|nr:TFIIB-type zinc finger domain-containing protein [Streptococcaceae bacterium]